MTVLENLSLKAQQAFRAAVKEIDGINAAKVKALEAEIERLKSEETGPREPPDVAFILREIGRLAKGAARDEAVYGLCPAGCGCVWRDNFDGTMSLGMNQRSCKVCESKPWRDLIPLYARPSHDVVPK